MNDINTIHQYLEFLTGLSEDANMPYVNITLDVGAGINAYKFIWTHAEQYKNVCIHLGMFHFMKENFKVIFTCH